MTAKTLVYDLVCDAELRGSWRDELRKIDRTSLARIDRLGPFALGESYIEGRWDVPHLDQFLFRVFTEGGRTLSLGARAHLIAQYLKELFVNSQRGEHAFVIGREHYDLGNDLFAEMLDRSMTYTCGYWEGATSLADAQRAKLDLVCRKLDLQPRMRVLDLGCGWGNFAEHAAREYGVSVVGCTVSEEQAEFAKVRCQGMPVKIALADFREVGGKYDRVVSLEMIEAVGRKNLPEFFNTVHRSLADDGLFVLQAISAETLSKYSAVNLDQYLLWILKYIFPNGYLPKLPELVEPARNKFIIEDLHNFGPDYDRTLCAWSEKFNGSWEKLRHRYDERFKRRWNYYLSSCAALFRARMVQLYQIVYSKAGAGKGYRSIR